jgi:hypothetical protein
MRAMTRQETTRSTPITGKVDRGDERVRRIEEAVLLLRGEWPATAYGLCETVNRATGLIIAPAGALDEALERTADEAMRIVESLYGGEAVSEVRRLAAVDRQSSPRSTPRGAKRRFHLPPLTHRRVRTRAGW